MVNFREDRAAYRVNSDKGFFGPDDHLYLETVDSGPVYIYFDGEPNEDLEPVNDLARVRMNTFLEKLDAEGRKVAEKIGKAFAGRPRSLDGALEVATAIQRENMSIMGTKRQNQETPIERIEDERTPEQGSVSHQPRKRGRPAKASLAVA